MSLWMGEEFMHVDPFRSMTVPSCSVRYFCLGALLIFVGSVLLCALGFTIILPYEATRDWYVTSCHVINSTYDNEHCSCDKQPAEWEQCLFKYPCLQVRVLYDIPEEMPADLNMTKLQGKGLGRLYRQWSDAFYRTCALYECGDEEWNVKQVRRFQASHGRADQKYTCFVDPADPNCVILERMPSSHLVHATLWPSLCLFVGLIIWMGLCLGCWTIDMEDKEVTRGPGRYGLL